MSERLLAIDVGNTNTVFALFSDEELKASWRLSTTVGRTADEYAASLSQLMALDGETLDAVDAVVISTVVPATLFELRLLADRVFKCRPEVVGEGLDLGISVNTPNPLEVGADRLVNAVGAYGRHGGSAIVVDFGTATTFDVVGPAGSYEGGVIAPGVNLSLEALHAEAARLPRIAIGRPATVVGRSTISAMRSGIYWGYVGLVEGLVKRIRDERKDASMKVIATGGLADLFARATSVIDVVDADLTLHGLCAVHRHNRDKHNRDKPG